MVFNCNVFCLFCSRHTLLQLKPAQTRLVNKNNTSVFTTLPVLKSYSLPTNSTFISIFLLLRLWKVDITFVVFVKHEIAKFQMHLKNYP